MRTLLIGSALLLVLAAGCKKPAENTPAAGTTEFKVGLVADESGINDQSFNASAWRGLQNAEKELGVKVLPSESREQSDFTRNLRSFAKQGYDIVFASGFSMQDAMKLVAAEYPDTKFVIIDGDNPGTPNTASVKFKEHEGTFLAGILAAGMAKSGTIGFVGGQHGPVISRFECGYKAGAMTLKPDIKIISQYAESWADPNKGKEFALLQFNQGADIIFHASGKTGIGVIDAAKGQPAGKYAIGVDSNQDDMAPGKVLTSMMKNIDVAVFDFIKRTKDGKFTPGDHVYGLKENGVGLSPMTHTKKDVPAELLTKIDELKQQVIDGKITPPSTDAELKTFEADLKK